MCSVNIFLKGQILFLSYKMRCLHLFPSVIQVALENALLICTTEFLLFFLLHDTLFVDFLYKMKWHFAHFPMKNVADAYFHIIKKCTSMIVLLMWTVGNPARKNHLFNQLCIVKWKWAIIKHNTHKLHKVSWNCSWISANYLNPTIFSKTDWKEAMLEAKDDSMPSSDTTYFCLTEKYWPCPKKIKASWVARSTATSAIIPLP